MKHRIFSATMVASALLALTGCETEDVFSLPEGAIRLTSEGYTGHGTKALVSGTSVEWKHEDDVLINNQSYTVKVEGTTAYVEGTGLETTAPIYAFYNCGTVTDNMSTTPTVAIPSRYASSYEGGKQVIALPMAAYGATASNTIQFKHLTAAMRVVVKNATGHDGLYLDSVKVSSATQKLCGSAALDLTAEGLGLAPAEAATDAEGTVTVYFDRESVTIANGATREVQVPILPIAAGDVTVKVFTHNKADVLFGEGLAPANYDYTFDRTAAAPALGRNVMTDAKIQITDGNQPATDYVTVVDHSLFSVSAEQKVRFSKGNLQATYDGSWTWHFAANQYDVILNGNNIINGNGTVSENGTVDLFGWVGALNTVSGALISAGDPAMYGISNSSTPSKYSNSTDDVLKNWGEKIGTGWRVLTGGSNGEWKYLFERNQTLSLAYCYVRATVNEIRGIILFPDHYIHPAISTTLHSQYLNNSSALANNTLHKIGADDWSKMEAAGAVFLPFGSERYARTVSTPLSSHGGYYWTSTHHGNYNGHAYRLNFTGSALHPDGNYQCDYGSSVRLVLPE